MEIKHEYFVLSYDDGDAEIYLFVVDYHHHYHWHSVVPIVSPKFYVVYVSWLSKVCS